MSKEVDALVIIGHSHMIVDETPRYNHEGIAQGLWYVRHGETKWYNDEPITEEDKTNLYAGEILLELGGLAASRYMQQAQERSQEPNPLRSVALDLLDEISPLQAGEVLRPDFAVKLPYIDRIGQELPNIFDAALTAEPSIEEELKEKWAQAQLIHAQRGKVAIIAYDAAALLEDLSKLKIDEVAPDEVGFDENLNVTSQSHNLRSLIDRTDAQAQLTEVPYYQTFSSARKNELELLTSALEDLRFVSQAITK